MPDDARPPTASAMKAIVGPLVWTLAVAALAATALAQLDRLGLGQIGWAFDLFAQFPRHWAAASLVAIIAAVVTKRWGLALMATVALAASLTSLAFTPPYATPKPAPAGAHLIRIVSANVHGSPEALKRLAALARSYDATLVSAYEAPALSGADLHAMFPGAQRIQLVDRSPNGRALSSRLMVVAWADVDPIALKDMVGGHRGVLRYQLPHGVQVIATHATVPDRPASMRERDALLSSLHGDIDTQEPFLVMGDFNTTPFSHIFLSLPGVRAGDPRLESTYPARAPLLGLPIDTVMFGGGLELVEHHVGPDFGSDHLPVFATFALPLPKPAPTPGR